MMFIGSPKLWIFGVALLAIAGAGAGVLTFSSREPLPELGRIPDLVYRRATERLVAEVVAPPGTERLLLPPIARDASEALRARVARTTEQRTGLEVLLPKRDESAPEDLTAAATAILRAWKDKLVAEWTGEQPELVLACRVQELTDDADRVRLIIEWEEQWAKSGEPLAGGVISEEIEKSWADGDYARAAIVDSSAAFRLGLWFAVLVIPSLCMTRWIRRVLREESNSYNATMVLALAVPGCLAGWVLTGFGAGWLGGGLTLISVAASGAFSFGYCTWVEELRR